MKTRVTKAFSPYLLLLAFIALWSVSQPLAGVQSPNQRKPSDCELSWSGRYRNAWGYELTVPPGRKGYPNSPVSGCGKDMVIMGDHGLVIPLSREPYERQRHIEIFAAYNSLEWTDIGTVADEWLRQVRSRAAKDTVQVLHRAGASLGGVAGLRITVRYQDDALQQQIIEDRMLFLRTRDRDEAVPAYEVTIYLRTPARSYQRDRAVFEALLATVRFTKPQK